MASRVLRVMCFIVPSRPLPAGAAASTAAAAATETAESTTTTAAAAESTAPSAAERSDAARPAAPRPAAPVAGTASWSATDPAHDQNGDEDQDDHPEWNRRARLTVQRARRADAVERHVSSLRDAADDAFGACEQTGAVAPLRELRRHDLAARFAGKSVGDPLLDAVADFNPDATL